MKKLLFLSLSLLFVLQMHAQLIVHQTGDKRSVSAFAENPQEFLGDLTQLRGFGVFLEPYKGEEKFDKLLGFYVKAQLLNAKGKPVAETKAIKAEMIPGGDTFFPGEQAFPGDLFDSLDKGRYELRLTANPVQKELANMCKQGEPKMRYYFER